MKIALLSDLHAEFRSQEVIPQLDRAVDVLVLAGDIDNCKKAIQRGLEIANGHARHIVQIAGNHEFYGERLDKGYDRLKRDAYAWAVSSSDATEVHFLQDDSVVIDGVKFLGSTLWTDYQLYNRAPIDMIRAEGYMNDHRRIKFKQSESVFRRFLPKDALEAHIKSREFIASERNFDGKIVVITHHAPSFMSVDPRFHSLDELNSAYASSLEHLMADGKISYWFHGHMHMPVDYQVYDTRVIANPHGYPGERENPQILYMEI